jgi:nitric oxide reductase subunit B
MNEDARRSLPPAEAGIDRFLRWGLVITLLVVVSILIYGTVAVHRERPPIPDQVVAPNETALYTKDDIIGGKGVFQRTDLMDFGSLYGNGAYFGPDWGTDYLHRQGQLMRDYYAGQRFGSPYDSLGTTDRAVIDQQVIDELKTNRYSDGVLTLTEGQVAAHQELLAYYRSLFIDGDKELGLPADTVRNAGEADELAAFFGWVAWTSVAQRPGEGFSYTNNWPHDASVGNNPTQGMYWWTWGSLAGLVVMSAGVYLFYRRFISQPAEALEDPAVPAEMPLTPSQTSTAKWFLLVPALLLLQALAGVFIAHYYADRGSFFGLDLMKVLPFNVLKAWHIQLAIAWVAAAWLGAGLFLAPIVGRREPRYQRLLSNVLWVAVVVVVVGASIGLWFGIKSNMRGSWFWLGNQGLEYIQLGRAFQMALFLGLLIWAAVLLRAFWPGLRTKRTWGSLEHLLLYSGAGIGVMYVFGMLPLNHIMASATLTDFWRWWVVHLWVEGMFEFFTVAVTGYAVLSMGLVSRRLVERTVYLEVILIFGAGILGTGHHYYWVGEPAVWIALGSMFSFLEVIPLGVMMAQAWKEYRAVRAAGRDFPQHAAFMYFTGAAVWNVLGAGVIGGMINPPIMSYFEHGQFLTLAHGHASMMGAFGLLAIGLLYFSVRNMVPTERWSDRLPRWALACFHGAIVLWLALNILPIGFAQVASSINDGYWYSRSLAFYDDWTLFQWLRMPGDILFGLAGTLVLLDLANKLRFRRPATVGEEVLLPPLPAERHLAA